MILGFASKRSKFGVGGCCRLDLFSLNKIFFERILDVRIISGGKCVDINNLPLARHFLKIEMFGG